MRGKARIRESLALVLLGMIISKILMVYGINPIWATATAFVIIAAIMLLQDRAILAGEVLSGALMFIVIVITYSIWFLIFPDAIARLWIPSALSGYGIFGIPIEELFWYTAAGFFVGVFYEFSAGVRRYTKFR